MADAQVGNIVATLRVDAAAWQQGLQQAAAQLQQFAQQITRLTGQLNQFSTAFQQAFTQSQQGLNALPQRAQQASQSFQQFNTQVNQTNQAFTVVNQTVQQFNTHLATTTNNVNNVRQGLQQAQGAASGFGSVWQGALSVAGGLGIVTSIGGIVSGLKSLATEAIQAASRMEALRAQFTALQGAAQGAVTLQNLFTTAQRLGVEFGTLANAFRQFDAATRGTALEGEKARVIFEQLATGMRGMGASSEQIGRALVTFQQIISKGRVEQEELRGQLAEALPGAVQIAARAFGVTTEALNKMIEKGQDGIQFVQLFANQFATEFGGKAATATNTLTAAWQRFANELEQFKGALAGGELIGQLRDLANWAATFLETQRKIRELREEGLGGTAPALPRDLAGARTLEARQKEIQDLRDFIAAAERGMTALESQRFGRGYFAGLPTTEEIEAARTKLLALQKVQEEVIKRQQDYLAAETNQPLVVPGARQADALRKIQDDLQKQLRDIDLTAAFVSPLELAEQRLKAIEESFKRMRDVVPQIGEGLRQTLIPTGQKTPFDEMIEASAAKYGQDPNVIRAIIQKESGFRPGVTGTSGEQGLMQIMPGTAAQYGAAGKNLFDAATNIELGTKIFADLMRRFNGDIDKALTAYNAGAGRGGIPLPTGPNATYAADVRRLIPRGPGDVLAQTEAQRRVAELAVEAEKPDTESRARIMAMGRAELQAMEERERLAEADARERRQQAFATGQEYIRGLEAEIAKQDQQMATLQRLAETYGEVKAARDGDTASALEAALANTVHADKAKELALAIREVATIEAQLPELRRQAAASAPAGELAIKQVRDEADALRVLEENLEAARMPRHEGGFPFGRTREELRLQQRTQEDIRTPEGQQQAQRIQQLRQEQEKLNFAVEVWYDLSQTIGQSWSQSLMSVIDGTISVSQAFEEMGRAILKTMADIAAQQATMALFQLGAGLLTGALTGGLTGGAAAGSGPSGLGTSSSFIGQMIAPQAGFAFTAQHGAGPINQPTNVLVGEGRQNPEWIFQNQQLQSLMTSAARQGAAGGQQSQVSIHNYPNKAAAEQGAAQQRALGNTAIINAVLDELGTGESSRINRSLRALQR